MPKNKSSPKNELGLGLGLFLIGILVILLVTALLFGKKFGPSKTNLYTILVGLYLIVWGFMYLASYFYEYKSFFFRALIWTCEHFSWPARREMALFYFVLAMVLGCLELLVGFRVIVL